jgi:hypothetical protein
MGVISLWSVEIIMQLRIYALFNCSKKVCTYPRLFYLLMKTGRPFQWNSLSYFHWTVSLDVDRENNPPFLFHGMLSRITSYGVLSREWG